MLTICASDIALIPARLSEVKNAQRIASVFCVRGAEALETILYSDG